MNILLIHPEFSDTFCSFKYALAFVRKRAAHPPLGLLTVAAMLPSEWSLRLVDTNVRRLKQGDLDWADCAFISAMGVQRASAQQIIARCEGAGLRIVAGGPLFTGEPEAFDSVDHLVLNEAELTLPDFLTDLLQDRPGRLYSSDQFADIHQTPMPRWDLLADVRRIQHAGLEVQGGFIVGFDHDQPSIFQRQIDFIQQSGIVTSMVGLLLYVHRIWLDCLRTAAILGAENFTTGRDAR